MKLARYEWQQRASVVLSAGPSSVVVELPDVDDAPVRPVTRRIGFDVPDSTQHVSTPLIWEGDNT